MFLHTKNLNRHGDRNHKFSYLNMRRRLLFACLGVVIPPVCHGNPRTDKNNPVHFPKCQPGARNVEKDFGSSKKSKGRRRYLVCQECLVKRAVQRSAFINKEA
jgi:hypothetical protein